VLVNEQRVTISSKFFTVADAAEAGIDLKPGPVYSAGTHTLWATTGRCPTSC